MGQRRRIRWSRVGLALELVGVVGAGLFWALGALRSVAAEAAPVRSVVVLPGETLWDLARRFGPPGADPREVVFELRRVNRLGSGRLEAGMTLQVPAETTARVALQPSGPSVF